MGFKESPPDSTYPLFLSGVSAGFPSPAEDYIDKNIQLLLETGSYYQDHRIVIFENDSTDRSREIIKDWSKRNSKIDLIDCEVPNCRYNKKRENGLSRNRQDNMVFYRNKCLAYIKQKYSDYDYLLLVDFDMVGYYSIEGLIHSMSFDNWDAIFVNGRTPYVLLSGLVSHMYDSLSFVDHSEDIKTRYQTISNSFTQFISSMKMMFISGKQLYKVKSAFNGSGLYRMSSILPFEYVKDWSCEHIGLHYQMIDKGYDKLYINPNWLLFIE
jgi:glycosyltransferase involved in cell wall biosynthesis